jgi:hypothetical protein
LKNPQEDYDILQKNVNGPEYLEYFQNKPKTPVYKPEKLLWEKPSDEFLSKFHLVLMQQQQTRKRSHQEQQSYQDQFNDTSPSSKRSLLSHSTFATAKQSTKPNTKTIKPPMQSINLLNAPEDIYYHITKKIQLIRQEIELVHLKKLARTPFKYLNKQQYMNQYSQLSKIIVQSLSAIKPQNGDSVKVKQVSNDDESEQMDTTSQVTTNEVVILD